MNLKEEYIEKFVSFFKIAIPEIERKKNPLPEYNCFIYINNFSVHYVGYINHLNTKIWLEWNSPNKEKFEQFILETSKEYDCDAILFRTVGAKDYLNFYNDNRSIDCKNYIEQLMQEKRV